ncbi:hypothetical protein ACFPVX_10500 [Cohnella faecalis]|uniref:Uncharacterized protein n=1 Tax=Cohnella faecalis TaxID=2315694 RepID=A0A398CN76_9BACL|nr:hypothetical protein [Cohnella faecalis]RIE03752.1 hypothetical protein D3H35_09345 [Cohnella faecalis]
MINNESRYIEKILTPKDKLSIESGINSSIYFFYVGFLFLFCGLLSILSIFVFSFLNQSYATIFFVITISMIFSSIFFLFLSERDPISSKALNEKLFIYFDLLQQYIDKNKKSVQIWMINRRLIKYLYELERSLNNVFIYTNSRADIQLIINLRELIKDDFSMLLKNNEQQVVLELIKKIKQAHLSAESIHLMETMKEDGVSEHRTRVLSIKKSLENCKQKISTNAEKQSFSSKLYRLIAKPSFLIILLIIVGIIMLIYMNTTQDFSRTPANLTAIGFILAIASLTVQNRK